MPQSDLPGEGLWGWLGRQFGYVRKAAKTDVLPAGELAQSNVAYRDCKIEEAPHPEQPELILRRTTIDEVIVEKRNDDR